MLEDMYFVCRYVGKMKRKEERIACEVISSFTVSPCANQP